jgi:hypothetical protein
MKHSLAIICFLFLLTALSSSCTNKAGTLTLRQSEDIKDSVQQMMQFAARDISHDGPVAWLRYFENIHEFFMASEGQLVFSNSDSATLFIKNVLVKQIQAIALQWSNVRIDPLTLQFANVAATWHEDITDFAGNKISEGGYFTAIAEKTLHGWQFRNAHWSVAK